MFDFLRIKHAANMKHMLPDSKLFGRLLQPWKGTKAMAGLQAYSYGASSVEAFFNPHPMTLKAELRLLTFPRSIF